MAATLIIIFLFSQHLLLNTHNYQRNEKGHPLHHHEHPRHPEKQYETGAKISKKVNEGS